jgi:NitT/TauT family transport system permease protein
VSTLAIPLQSPLALRITAGVVLLGFWEIFVSAFAARFVARPTEIVAAIPKALGDPAYWSATGATLTAVLIGLAIALVLGTLLGLVLGRIKGADRALSFWVSSFYAMPMIAALPLLTVWFGFDKEARLATIVFAALFSVVINVADGARSTPAEYLEVGRAYRAKPRHIWFDITLLSAVPYLIAGARLAAGRSLIGATLAEIYTSVDGLGYYILSNARGLRQNEAFVGVLMLCLFGLIFEGLMVWALRRFFPWYRRDEEAAD